MVWLLSSRATVLSSEVSVILASAGMLMVGVNQNFGSPIHALELFDMQFATSSWMCGMALPKISCRANGWQCPNQLLSLTHPTCSDPC